MRTLGISVLLVLVLGSCSTVSQSRNVEAAGFLDNVEQLRTEGPESEALTYRNASFDPSEYSKIFVDSTQIWMRPGKKDLKEQDAVLLSQFQSSAFVDALSPDWEIADGPGPGTLHLRSALTESCPSSVFFDVATTFGPYARAYQELRKLTVGSYSFVGSSAIELEVLDSVTQERLFATIDRREGTKSVRVLPGTWSDVREIGSHWASELAVQLKSPAEVRL